MIPGLLHGRSLVGAGAGGIVAAPAYLPRLAYKAGSSSAAANAAFTVNPDGTWSSTGTGYTAESGSWYLPTTVGAGAAYEVRITPTLASGGGAVVTNAASGWIAASAARLLQVAMNRYTNGKSAATYNVLVEFRLSGGGATVSSGSFTLTIEAEVGSSGGGGCPTIDMVMADGTRAEFVNAGDIHLVCDPETGEEVMAEVEAADTREMPCVELVTRDGARFKCSTTAPMATGQGEVKAPDMLGCAAHLKVSGTQYWSDVVEVNDIGMQLVRYIVMKPVRHANDRYFWVGGPDGTLWLHHNAKDADERGD